MLNGAAALFGTSIFNEVGQAYLNYRLKHEYMCFDVLRCWLHRTKTMYSTFSRMCTAIIWTAWGRKIEVRNNRACDAWVI
jgi:hypothetical protein